MKIFIAYATPDLLIAEQLFHRLQSEGHEVFFDREHLEPGNTYDKKVRKALQKSELLIFLASIESISSGAYSLTELALFINHHKSPDKKILPVLLDVTLKGRLPSLLNTVTQLLPDGNMEAEVVAAVANIAKQQTRPMKVLIFIIIVAVFITGFAWWWSIQAPPLKIKIINNQPLTKSHGNIGNIIRTNGQIINNGSKAWFITKLIVDTNNPAISAEVISTIDSIFPALELGANKTSTWQVDLSFYNNQDKKGLSIKAINNLKWRICLNISSQQICTLWGNHARDLKFPPPPPPIQVEGIIGRLVAITMFKDRYLGITTNPNQLIQISSSGRIKKMIGLSGEPTAIDKQGKRIAITTRTPDQLLLFESNIFNINSLEQTASYKIPKLKISYDDWEDELSSQPRDLAITESGYWIAVSGVSGEAGFLFTPSDGNGTWFTPSDLSNFSMGSEDWKIVSARDRAWAVSTETIPASVYTLSKSAIVEYTGHDNETISCSSDLATNTSGNLININCENELIEYSDYSGIKSYGKLLPSTFTKDTWVWASDKIIELNGQLLVGRSYENITLDEPVGVDVQLLQPGKEVQRIFSAPGYEITSMALLPDQALIVLSQNNQDISPVIFTFD